MDYDAIKSLPAMFFATAARRSDRPFLWVKVDGQYRPVSWAETASQVSRLARGLVALGIAPGDRVVLVAENRPEWVIADLAIMSAGAITVPAYTTNTVEDHRHILSNSGARAVITSKPPLSERVGEAALQLPNVRRVIAMEGAGENMRAWEDVLTLGAARPDDIAERIAAIQPDDVACLIYTSGTGGLPKGVAAHPPQHHRQLPRRLSPARDARARRRGVPQLPAAVAFLRAHGGADVPDLDRRRDLFRRGRRHARRQSCSRRGRRS